MKTYLSNILSLEKELDLESEYFIHQLFEAQVLKTPAAIAAIVQDQKLTYEELNIKANQVAHYLRALAIGPEILVGVCLERSLEMLIVSLGVLKAGAAYVPLDPTHPQERLALVIMDARMPILLTQTHLINTLPQSRTRLIAVDQAWDVIIRQPLENPINLGIPDDLACVMYTPGSAGEPQGFQIQHRGAVDFLKLMAEQHPGLTATDTLLAAMTITFDISVPKMKVSV